MTIRIYIALFYGFTALCLSVVAGPARAEMPVDAPGGLLLADADGQALTLPLEHTAIDARVRGEVATVTVRQTFFNDTGQPLDVTYLFPLSGGARVMALTLDLADGRQAAVAIRDEIGQALFSHEIDALPPGRPLTVTLRYVQSVHCLDGTCAFAVPLLQANLSDEDAYGDCWHDGEDEFAQDLPAYLQDGVVSIPDDLDAGRLTVTADLAAPDGVAQIWSDTHPIDVTAYQDRRVVDLTATDWIANRDFVLRYRLADAPRLAANLSAAPAD